MISVEDDARPGFFRFLHHDQPIEWSRDVINRIEYIQTQKPLKEIPGRLAAICRVPDEMISPRLWKAAQACGEARRAYEETGRAYEEAWRAYEEAQRAYEEARRADGEAGRAYMKAGRAWGKARRAEWPDRGLALALSLGPLPAGVTWDANNTCLSFV